MSSTALKPEAHARTSSGTGWTVQKSPLKPRSVRCRRHPVQPARQKRFRRGMEGHVTRERGALPKGQWRTQRRRATLSSHAGRGGQGERACLRSLAPYCAERLLERGGGHDTCSRGGGGAVTRHPACQVRCARLCAARACARRVMLLRAQGQAGYLARADPPPYPHPAALQKMQYRCVGRRNTW